MLARAVLSCAWFTASCTFLSGHLSAKRPISLLSFSFYIHVCRKPEEGDLTFKDTCCARNIHSLFLKHENPREFAFTFQEQLNNNLLHLLKYKRPFSSHLADIYLGSFLESVTMVYGKYQTGVCRTGAVKGQHIVFWSLVFFAKDWWCSCLKSNHGSGCRSIHTLVTKVILELEFKTILKFSVTSREPADLPEDDL